MIIHALFISAIVSAGSMLDKANAPMVISFDIAGGGTKGEDFSIKSDESLKTEPDIKRNVQISRTDRKAIIEKKAMTMTPALDMPVPKPSRQETAGDEAAKVSRGAGDSVRKSNDGGTETQERDKAAKERYLREHYLYIKDRIHAGIVYPDQARRMGWQGKVRTSFIIHLDGTVSDIKIVSSSGFRVLDENAAMTIRAVSPFPSPPCKAMIIIPIEYRLIAD